MSDQRAATWFLRDLQAAVVAWRAAWWLPVISVLLGASLWANGAEQLLAADPETLGTQPGDAQFAVVLLLVSITELGWFGTEREVYRRVWVGQDPAEQLFKVTRRFVLPFLRVGLLVGWPLLLAPALLDPDRPDLARLIIYLLTLAVYVVATFVPAEVVYRPQSTVSAVRRGVQLLRREFRRVWMHALVVPVLVVTVGAAASTIPEPARSVIGGLGTLVGLATKGAIAHRWLLLHDAVDAGTSPNRAGELPA